MTGRTSPAAAIICSLALLNSSSLLAPSFALADAVYQPSEAISGIQFDMGTLRDRAPGNGASASGSDNWTITWADDGHQYTSFGDGNGFGTFNSTRASLGVARIEGDRNNYSAFDVFKTGDASGGWAGKSLGIISINGTLYLFRNGTGSTSGAFVQTELYESADHGSNWTYTGVRWHEDEFFDEKGIFSPTFLQFGRDYAGARDQFVYIYAPEQTVSVSTAKWNVQNPGKISLLRVPVDSLTQKSSYEYFNGTDGSGNPLWTTDISQRKPVFQDATNGIMRTSVSYNSGLGRYILTTQQVNRFRDENYHIGIYEAPEPWGPWRTVVFGNANDVGPNLNVGLKTVYWNFSNKWLSSDGLNFVLVYTGDGADEWGTVEGRFLTGDPNPQTTPMPPEDLRAD